MTMKLKHYGAMLVNFVIDYANGDISRREFDLDYSGYVVDFFPRFEKEHPLLARRFADTIDRTYDDCSWMPDDRFQDMKRNGNLQVGKKPIVYAVLQHQ